MSRFPRPVEDALIAYNDALSVARTKREVIDAKLKLAEAVLETVGLPSHSSDIGVANTRLDARHP